MKYLHIRDQLLAQEYGVRIAGGVQIGLVITMVVGTLLSFTHSAQPSEPERDRETVAVE